MRILVVEDEKKVARFIKKGLEEEYYAVDIAYDGENGLDLAQINEYDLILLDIMLPKLDGMEVLRRIRDNGSTVPILILTAKDSVEDIVTYYESLNWRFHAPIRFEWKRGRRFGLNWVAEDNVRVFSNICGYQIIVRPSPDGDSEVYILERGAMGDYRPSEK